MKLHPTVFLLFYVGLDIFLTVGSFGFYNPDLNFDLHDIWKVLDVFNYHFFSSPFDFLLLTLLRVLLIICFLIFTRIGKGKKLYSLILDHGILSTLLFIFAVFKSELLLADSILRMCPGVYFNVLVTTMFNFTVSMVIKHVIINGAAYQRLEVEGPIMANVENAAAPAVAEEADSTPLLQQFKLIVKILWVQKKYLVPTLVLVAIWCITYIIVTAIAGDLIASLSAAKNLMIIVLGALSYGWFNFMRYSSQRLKSIFLAKTQKNVSRDLQKRLFAAVLRQEIGYFDTIRTGDLSSRLTSEYKSISEDMPEQFCVLIEMLLFAIMSIIWMSSITWNLTIVILATLPILIKVAQIEAKYKGELSKKITEKTSERNGIIQEVVSGIRIVRSHAAEQQETERHGKVVDTVEDLEEKMKKLDAMFAFVWGMIWLVTMFIVFVYAGYLLEQKRMKSEDIVTFIYFLFTLQDAIVKLAVIFSKVVKTIGTSYKVIQLLNRQPEFNYDEGTETPNLTGNIKFENVTFAYPTRSNDIVLNGTNLSIEANSSTAFVGPSGNGKTTIVQLVQQLYRPVTGRILIDGMDIKEMDHEFYHRMVGIVNQEPSLFSTTIEENIKYGFDAATEEDVQSAAETANVTSFVEGFADKFKAECGSNGTQMSGGQKQRIAIARALIRNPKILILDEATSALDAESEQVFQEALDTYKKERTVIIVAHRLSTIRHADRIVYIEKGEVKEVGSHDELMANGGLYAKLVEKQTRPELCIEQILKTLSSRQPAISGKVEKIKRNFEDADKDRDCQELNEKYEKFSRLTHGFGHADSLNYYKKFQEVFEEALVCCQAICQGEYVELSRRTGEPMEWKYEMKKQE